MKRPVTFPTILCGDAGKWLSMLDAESVHCCVTSPPYWGLRDYRTATWEGGDPECDHKQESPVAGLADGIIDDQSQRNRDGDCKKCGAARIDSQLGLESSPEKYAIRMVELLRDVRRVLRDDGTLWLNLGDSYSRGNRGTVPAHKGAVASKSDAEKYFFESSSARMGGHPVIKKKELCGIPWRVALALQEDGWYLRQDIIWHKPNPMPESVRDRCTRSHEYIFLLAKKERYYYDSAAIMELAKFSNKPGRDMRNRRDVWMVPVRPYRGAHFATFPPELIEPCILAGCPEGGVVLDPFAGSGTTGMVARKNNRNFVMIELNSEYCKLARKRIYE